MLDPLLARYHERRTLRRIMQWHDSLHGDFVARLWDDPRRLVQSGEPLQDKDRCLVARLESPDGTLVLKRHNWGGLWKRVCKSLRTPQARQSFRDGLYLAAHGVRTPLPLAIVEHRLGPFGGESYLLSEFVRGTSLYRLLRYESPPRELVEYLADQLLALCSQFAELQFTHNDLKPENLMVDPAGRLWLIDLEKVRRHRDSEAVRAPLLEDMNRFLHARNWRENRAAGELFRRRLAAHPFIAASLSKLQPKRHPLCDPARFDSGYANKLSVLVVAPQAALNLRDCIDSFRDIADEIVVANDQNAKETRSLAASLQYRLIERESEQETPVELCNRALAATSHPWILVVEGRQRVSPDLAKEIQCLLTADPQVEAFRIPCRRVYLGHANKYGVFRRDSPVRLFKRELGTFVDDRLRTRIHVRVTEPGRTKSKLMIYSSWQVADLVQTLNQRSTELANHRYQSGQKPRLLAATFRSARRFVKNYFLRQACLDGAVGLQTSLLWAMSAIVVEIKLWGLYNAQLQHEPSGKKRTLDVQMFRRDAKAKRERGAA